MLFTLIACVLLTFSVKAQLIYNDEGDVVPFSLANVYSNKINIDSIHTLVLPTYDNDSLCMVYNNGKSLSQLENTFCAGFPIDKQIDIKQNGKKFTITEGTVWIYTIESPSAETIGIHFKDIDVPEGALLSLIQGDEYSLKEGPHIYTHEDINKLKFPRYSYKFIFGNKMMIEYFEPVNSSEKRGVVIDQIEYGFYGVAKKKEKSPDEKRLKSEVFGTSQYSSCQHDVVCQEVSGWENEANAVVYLQIRYTYGGDPNKLSTGTGFFINKAGGYSGTDHPVLITCGHLFAPKTDGQNIFDISNTYTDFYAFVNYQNRVCSDQTLYSGTKIRGSFNRLMLGSSYNKDGDPLQGYIESDDYAVMQTTKDVNDLNKYNILYAGWTSTPNYLNNGYVTIGHPGNDVKKINKDNDRAWASSGKFGLYFDLGVTEHGFSGSPVFNTSKKIVGWLCTGSGNCQSVGMEDTTNHTTCGRFDDLHFSLIPYIDPNGVGNADDSTPPAPPTLPSHCTNCIQDADETGIDCGGSCLPCGMQDVRVIKTQADITSNNIAARYELDTDPDPGYRFEYRSGTFNLNAGNSIQFKNNVLIKDSVNLKAAIIPELQSEPPRGCQTYCISAANVFTPDGDGNLDYWIFSQSFVQSYSLVVKDRWGITVYTKANTPIYENGTVNGWDGTGLSANGVYYISLTFSDCSGTTRTNAYTVNVFGLKSANINELQGNLTDNGTNIDNETFKIIAYPNPTGGKVLVESYNCNLVFDCVLTDVSGKVLTQVPNNIGSGEIDLSPYPSGMYLLRVKSGENIQLCKLIKK